MILMMREPVVRVGHADLRVGAGADLASVHEADDARQIALIGEPLQVEHQLGVLFEGRRHACTAARLRQVAIVLLLRLLNAALDVANRVEILRQLGLVARAEAPSAAQRRARVTASRMLRSSWMRASRSAALPPSPNSRSKTARGLISACSGVVGVAPGDGVGIRAAVAAVADAGALHRVEPDLERGELRLLPNCSRGDLVHRDARIDVGAGGLARVHAREPRRAPARVLADAFAGNGLARLVVEVREHQQAVLERRERLHDRRELEPRAFRRGRPGRHVADAVGKIDDAEAPGRLRGAS